MVIFTCRPIPTSDHWPPGRLALALEKHLSSDQSPCDTADGWNTAPVDMVHILKFIGENTPQVVQHFFHQEYSMKSWLVSGGPYNGLV